MDLLPYRSPDMEKFRIMTDELAEEMPQEFAYRKLTDKQSAIILKTYLGRDYDRGPRFGNYISHVILYDIDDLSCYPCDLYKSDVFRTNMTYEEVNSQERPAYLPEPMLIQGNIINPDRVSDFLCKDDNMRVFEKMLASLIAFEKSKEKTRKRMLIYDNADNIILWIAALQYSLPLKIALGINFTTYDYDPTSSVFHICGVLGEGTKFSYSMYDDYNVFDLVNGKIPTITADEPFLEFISVNLAYSYDTILAFHDFVVEKLDYHVLDESFYDLYYVYLLFTRGLRKLSLEDFVSAMITWENYAKCKEKSRVAEYLLNDIEYLFTLNIEHFMKVINVILPHKTGLNIQEQKTLECLIVNKAIDIITECDKNKIVTDFNKLRFSSEKFGISVIEKMAEDEHRNSLLDRLQISKTPWRHILVIDELCKFIKEAQRRSKKMSLNECYRKLLGSLVCSAADQDAYHVYKIANSVINDLSDNHMNLTSIMMTFDDLFREMRGSNNVLEKLWEDTFLLIFKKYFNEKDVIHSILALLLDEEKYEHVYLFFKSVLDRTEGKLHFSEIAFNQQMNIKNRNYMHKYLERICADYYSTLSSLSVNEAVYKAKKNFTLLILKSGYVPVKLEYYIDETLKYIPFEVLKEKDMELINVIQHHYDNYNKIPPPKRQSLFVLAILIAKVKDFSIIIEIFKEIKAGETSFDLGFLDHYERKKYLTWIMPNLFAICKSSDDLLFVFNSICRTDAEDEYFIDATINEGARQFSKSKDTTILIYIFSFILKTENDSSYGKAGAIIKKLVKKDFKIIDENICSSLMQHPIYMSHWNRLKALALPQHQIKKKRIFKQL